MSFREDPVLLSRVLSAIDASVNDRFAEAESLCIAIAGDYPSSPYGPLFVAGTIHAAMIDQESNARHADYNRWRRRAEHMAEALGESADAEFVRGVAAGYEAVYEARWGGWFAALKKGLSAKKHFDRALQRDSTFVDAYLGIGNYNFWKSVKTDFINWTPLVTDNRREGLAQLQQVVIAGTVAKAAARAALAAALVHEERYADAIAHADTLAQEYPDGKTSLWIRAHARFHLYEWDRAYALFAEIEQRIRAEGPGNYFNLIECAYYRAQCDYESGRWAEAMDICLNALAYPVPEEIKKRQSGKLDELRKMHRELKKMVGR
ncbi:MAG TPA: hypothetical protein VLB27_04890 [candidate division Zixibacteria bacterium]|nr:hypothetical protein [candidate division Zixibacteria bacterium]